MPLAAALPEPPWLPVPRWLRHARKVVAGAPAPPLPPSPPVLPLLPGRPCLRFCLALCPIVEARSAAVAAVAALIGFTGGAGTAIATGAAAVTRYPEPTAAHPGRLRRRRHWHRPCRPCRQRRLVHLRLRYRDPPAPPVAIA